MMQRSSIGHQSPGRADTTSKPEPIRITIFTSDQCVFCNEAKEVVKEAVGRVPFYQPYIEVVETPVEKAPKKVEHHQVLAVPTVFVARSRIVGMPRVDDLEQLIHQEMLSNALK